MPEAVATGTDRELLDADHDEYVLAGALIGSTWRFPNGRVRTVDTVVQQTETHQGDTMTFPELRFDHGPRVAARGFQRRITPSDIGDVEPEDPLANQIVDALRAARAERRTDQEDGGDEGGEADA